MKFMHYVIVYTFYGLEIYEIYRVNYHGPVMKKIYKKNCNILKILCKI